MRALVVLYQAIRRAMIDAVQTVPGTDPDRAYPAAPKEISCPPTGKSRCPLTLLIGPLRSPPPAI
jgi:hypothetical protein